MIKRKILFVCIHNSARSQMAEAWLNYFCGECCEAHSAGLEAGTLNPLVVEVMKEVAIDISANKTKTVSSILAQVSGFSHVITVCDEASAERCPMVPGVLEKLHWNFPDPAKVTGNDQEKKAMIRFIRDGIRDKVKMWASLVCSTHQEFL